MDGIDDMYKKERISMGEGIIVAKKAQVQVVIDCKGELSIVNCKGIWNNDISK